MLKILAVSVLVLIVVYFWIFNNKKIRVYNRYMKRRKMFEDSIRDFQATEKYINQNMALALNSEDEKICVSVMKDGVPESSVYQYKDVAGCEILEDGVAVKPNLYESEPGADNSQENRPDGVTDLKESLKSDQALTGRKVSRIDLKILFKNSNNPSVLANFLFWEVSKGSVEYKKLYADALRWFEKIDNIMKGR